MTTLALNPHPQGSRFYGKLAAKPMPEQRYARAALNRVLQGTSQAELDALERTVSPASPNLRNVWELARKASSESVRQALGERALSTMEADGFEDEDIEFLRGRALSSEAPTWEAVASVRVFGTLAEDGLVPRALVLESLEEALVHHEPQRRLAAAEALWQCDARETLPVLKKQASSEKHPDVLATLEHVISIFER